MKTNGLMPVILIIIMVTFIFPGNSFAQDKNLVVRIARLQIDSAKLEN